MSRLQIRIQDTLRKGMEEQAAKLGLSISEYVIGAIVERLRRDTAAASRIVLSNKDRELFFKLLDDTSPLPDSWNRAKELAGDVEG